MEFKEPFSDDLYRIMESKYREHGASSNGAQLTIRYDKLKQSVEKYGENRVRYMLEHDFDGYHNGNF